MKAKILVAEADSAIRRLIRTVLEYSDYQVCEAEDDVSFLEFSKIQDIALIILDCLGQKTGGLQMLKTLRCNVRSRTIPVIAMTGLGQYSYDLGILATSCLVKPFRPSHLIAKVKAALEIGSSAEVHPTFETEFNYFGLSTAELGRSSPGGGKVFGGRKR